MHTVDSNGSDCFDRNKNLNTGDSDVVTTDSANCADAVFNVAPCEHTVKYRRREMKEVRHNTLNVSLCRSNEHLPRVIRVPVASVLSYSLHSLLTHSATS